MRREGRRGRGPHQSVPRPVQASHEVWVKQCIRMMQKPTKAEREQFSLSATQNVGQKGACGIFQLICALRCTYAAWMAAVASTKG